jgi:putative ABC transport system permease protein
MLLEISGGHLDLLLVGWYSEMEDSGRIAQISLQDLRSIEPNADAGGYFAEVAEDADASAVRDAVLAATNGTAKVELVDRSTDELDAFRLAFIMISVLVLSVALVNLVGTTFVSIRERQRDIGVLKTVGFTPNQIGVSVAAGAAAYALAAVVIGVPLGLIASRAMHDAVGRATGSGPGFGSPPQAAALLIAAAVIVLGSVALAALAARRAARTPVAEILRAE